MGTLWSAVMMLDHLGHAEAAGHLMNAIRSSLRSPESRTPDLGGGGDTPAVTGAVIDHLRS